MRYSTEAESNNRVTAARSHRSTRTRRRWWSVWLCDASRETATVTWCVWYVTGERVGSGCSTGLCAGGQSSLVKGSRELVACASPPPLCVCVLSVLLSTTSCRYLDRIRW